MQKLTMYGVILSSMVSLSACSSDSTKSEVSTTQNRESTTKQNSRSQSNYLVVYYSEPESEGTDAVAGASRAEYENRIVGNTALMAEWVAEQMNSDIYEIETTESYPGNHEKLVDQVKEELSQGIRPRLSSSLENLEDYDTIFIGYPIWWSDIPTPLYAFLEDTDLSGKRIIPFSTHGGSGFSNTISTISELEPDAEVETQNVLTISRENISEAREEVNDWLNDLGF
ncbi:flavodoxin [Enterococcus sp. BWM-S5]|uniref:Flavodoxin n=1 Tax=Enterococcus larvae TaxID=2794352 RepID=A0ABS4CGM3_9ENTE|nr:flavodoxin [Enterococcus larvae]MBP1045753.1 flavodoxin [Enterococcus larvae]